MRSTRSVALTFNLPCASGGEQGGHADAGRQYSVANRSSLLERPWNDGLAAVVRSRRARGSPAPGRAGARFSSPNFGAKGWIGVGLDEATDWLQVEAFVPAKNAIGSWRQTAAKLVA